jgi:uncharacterized protein
MKYLVLFAVLLIAYLLWRNARIDRGPGRNRGAAPPAGPLEMVSCAQCGVHLPKPEAIGGADGRLYCSQEHRLRGGG